MRKPNIIQEKTYSFSLKVVRLCRFLVETRKEFVLSKQLCRSGTSIGANVEEAINAQTKKDFIYKMSISLKEANETKYWIRLIIDSGCSENGNFNGLLSDIDEIIALLVSIIKTSRLSFA